jgi:biopolymer transport protein ExbD
MKRLRILGLVIMAVAMTETSALAQDAAASSGKPIAVHVSPSGAYTWNGEVVTLDQLRGRMEAAAARDPKPEITLDADPKVKYADIATVMQLITASGLGTKLGIIGGTR